MAILKDEWLIPVGGICLAIALLVDRFVPGDGVLDLVLGILIGLAIALNLAGLHKSRNR
ncbi:MAG: hypothetical protein JSW61_08555 [Candidatus Thorarchaeota archaeon]|nr:MAG: hypothetical protein JSW61_08555 [Candidatus Thorarchaeota archaeon]